MTSEKRKFDTGFEKGFIKKSSKGEYYAFCSACDEHINVSAKGTKTSINQHTQTNKHKSAVSGVSTSKCLENFLINKSNPSPLDDKTAAAEGAWAFHTVAHSQSFSSNDCSSNLFPVLDLDQGVKIAYDDVRDIASRFLPSISENDSLFDEVSALNNALSVLPDEQFQCSAEKKWIKILKFDNYLLG